jgi:hypothetical protein
MNKNKKTIHINKRTIRILEEIKNLIVIILDNVSIKNVYKLIKNHPKNSGR